MQLKDLLKNEGYLTMALPADDIEVQQILIEDSLGGLKRLPDKVFKIFKQGDEAALPITKKDITVSNISGSVILTSDIKASIGFMEDLVKKIGVSLGFKFDISSDEQLVFMFESPLKDEISSFIDLDKYLNDATVNEGTFGDKLKDNDIYIITAVLKSFNFAIGIIDKNNVSTALTLPSIKDFVEGSITASKNSDIKRVYQYKGEKALIFGVQAVQVLYNKTFWQGLFGKKGNFKLIDTTGVIVRDDENVKVKLLKTASNFL